MGVQEDTCWRCGVAWRAEPRPALRLIEGGAAPDAQPAQIQQVSTAERLARHYGHVGLLQHQLGELGAGARPSPD